MAYRCEQNRDSGTLNFRNKRWEATISAFKESALDYLSLGFEPIPVLTKTGIPKGATGREGTVTADKIAHWLKDERYTDANVALRPNGWISIDVDHYEDKKGAEDLAEWEAKHGPLPVTPSSTARGQESPSRQHFFIVPEGYEAISRLSSNVEIVQRSHRYAVVAPSFHPRTGAQYEWFDAEGEPMWGMPSPDDFEMLPEAWIEALRKTDDIDHEGFGGDIGDWLSTLPTGDPTETVRAAIERMPREKFNHDDVLRTTYHIVRLGAEGHTGIEWALKTIEATWVKPPYNSSEYRKELDDAIAGAVRRAGGHAWPDELPKSQMTDIIERIDGVEDYFWGDKEVSDSNRRALIQTMYNAGADRQEIMSFVWHSQQNVAEHVADVWNEVVAYEPLEESPATAGVEHSLLTDDERERLRFMPNFIDKYQYVAGLREETPNLPYHRANAWTLLSLVFGNIGVVPKKGTPGGLGLNLYVMPMGQTTSGKGEGKNQLLSTLRFVLGSIFDGVDIGGDPSPEAMHKKMIERDGETTFFNLDEGDQLFDRMSQKGGYSSGLQQKITDWYEGRISGRLRIGDEDGGKSAKGYLVVWLMGVPEKIMGSLTRGQVEDGFIARFIPYFGNPRNITAQSLETAEQDDDEISLGYDPYVKAMSSELQHHVTTLRLSRFDMQPHPIRQTPEARDRLSKARRDLFVPYAGHALAQSMIEPSMLRMGISMWKCAALIAMSRGSKLIEVDDVLVAVRAAEEWVPNLIKLMEGVASNDWTAQLDKVLQFVQKRESVSKAETYRQFKDMGFQLDNVTKSLMQQKLIKENNKDGKWEAING